MLHPLATRSNIIMLTTACLPPSYGEPTALLTNKALPLLALEDTTRMVLLKTRSDNFNHKPGQCSYMQPTDGHLQSLLTFGPMPFAWQMSPQMKSQACHSEMEGLHFKLLLAQEPLPTQDSGNPSLALSMFWTQLSKHQAVSLGNGKRDPELASILAALPFMQDQSR
jgi:hypothetical protein